MATDCPWSARDVEAFARGEPTAYSPPLPAGPPTAEDLETFRLARRVGYLASGPAGDSFPAFRLWWDWCWSAGHPFVVVRWRYPGRRVELDLTHAQDIDQAGALELGRLLAAVALPGTTAIDTGPTLWGTTVATADAELVAAQVVDLLLDRSE